MIELESALAPNPQTHSPVGKADSQRLFRQYQGGHLKWAGCRGQARGIFLVEGLPELNLGGIVELAGAQGARRFYRERSCQGPGQVQQGRRL